MGGGSGSDAPSSAPVQAQAPDFLASSIGKGKYNIGIAGTSGAGKSSLLNSILGDDIAKTDFVECTGRPSAYPLPLDDPRGHFHAFLERLPDVHQRCATQKLNNVTIWDLPGCGTRLHPFQTYVQDKGLLFFDYVIVLVRDRVEETDCKLVQALVENNIKHIICRSKFDIDLKGMFVQRKKELRDRKPNTEDLIKFAQSEIERIRQVSVREIREQVPRFHGHVYLVMASQCFDEDDIYYDAINELIETQLAVNHLFVDIIYERHGHDLRRYFDHSMYGCASKVAWNFVWSMMDVTPTAPVALGFILIGSTGSQPTSEIGPDDSASQL